MYYYDIQKKSIQVSYKCYHSDLEGLLEVEHKGEGRHAQTEMVNKLISVSKRRALATTTLRPVSSSIMSSNGSPDGHLQNPNAKYASQTYSLSSGYC